MTYIHTHTHLVVGAEEDELLEHQRGPVFYRESDVLESAGGSHHGGRLR